MTTNPITQLLDHLGIEQVHIAARMAEDVVLSIRGGPHSDQVDRVGSLTLIAPNAIPMAELERLERRVTMVASDRPLFGDQAMAAAARLPEMTTTILADYKSFLWADVVAEHGPIFLEALLDQQKKHQIPEWTGPSESSGSFAGVTYRVFGRGQPLLLLPLGLAPSAWEPLIKDLSEEFRVIVAGGAELGMIPTLETRGQSAGYQSMMAELFRWIDPQPGETIGEIGCGTGVVMRWLHGFTGGRNPISGIDLNNYLLGEAASLAEGAGLGDVLTFSQGDAENLADEDDSFDITFCTTVMEEVDADKMMDELCRVTRPGGRVGVVVRATDMAMTLNLALPKEELRRVADLEDRPEGPGCASAGLYQRMRDVGFQDLRFGPYLATFTDASGPLERYATRAIIARLGADSAGLWTGAIDAAQQDGTFLLAWPHHLAVGTVPR